MKIATNKSLIGLILLFLSCSVNAADNSPDSLQHYSHQDTLNFIRSQIKGDLVEKSPCDFHYEMGWQKFKANELDPDVGKVIYDLWDTFSCAKGKDCATYKDIKSDNVHLLLRGGDGMPLAKAMRNLIRYCISQPANP